MGTRNSLVRGRDTLIGPFLLLLGVAGVLWAWTVLPSFRLASIAEDAAKRILSEERFKPAVLNDIVVQLDRLNGSGVSSSRVARDGAIVRVRVAEESERKATFDVDRDMMMADETLRAVLSIFPADPFLWLKLYSVENARYGFGSDSVGYLTQSYRVGPLEGWVALRRNQLGLSVFQMLTEGTKKDVVSEFVGLVDSGFTENAAVNFESVGWTKREELLANLGKVNIALRHAFAKRLALDGVKVSIPGIEIDERPWR